MKWSNSCGYCGCYWTACTCHEHDYPEEVNYYHDEYSIRCNMCGEAIVSPTPINFSGTCSGCEKELHDESLEAAYEYAESCGGTVEVRNGRVTVIEPPVREEPQCYICRCPTDKNEEICDFCISENYTHVIKLKPGCAEAYYRRGLARYKLNQFGLANSDFDKAIELNPDYAEAYYRRGRLQFWQSEYEVIETEYELSHSEAGTLNLKCSDTPPPDLTSSISDFDKAVELNPDYAEAYFYRGRAKDRSNQFASAVADFDKVIELQPDYVEAVHYREISKRKAFDDYIAWGNSELRKPESYYAIDYFDKAIELQPDSAEAYYSRGLAKMYGKGYSRGACRYESANSDFDKAIELTPDDPKVYYCRGDVRHKLKQFESAIADYDKAIELSPCFYYAYYHRGHTKYKLRQFESAISDYDKTIEPTPDCVDPYYYRGLAKLCLSEYNAAIADFSIVIEHDYTHACAYISRAVAHSFLSQSESATADYNEAIELYSTALIHGKELKHIIIGWDEGVNDLLKKNGVEVDRLLCSEWCGEMACRCSANHPMLGQYSAYAPRSWWISDEYHELNDCAPAAFSALFQKFTEETPFLVVPDKEGLVGVFWTCYEDGEPCSYVRKIPIAVSAPNKADEPDIDDIPF